MRYLQYSDENTNVKFANLDKTPEQLPLKV